MYIYNINIYIYLIGYNLGQAESSDKNAACIDVDFTC